MNPLKLSFTSINTYNTCGKKYELHYKKRLRSKYAHAALLFGSAIDDALNTLLLTKDVNKSNSEFEKTWNSQYVNDVKVKLSDASSIVYAESDYDRDLLESSDYELLEQYLSNTQLDYTLHVNELYDAILAEKKQFGYDKLREDKQRFYNYSNWLSLRRKGLIMIKSYNEKVLPKIRNVLAVQHKTSLINQEGDEVQQVLDLVVEWEDGSIILFDNKTSAREYDIDSAGTSQQLISYYHKAKTDFNVNAVGFIVLRKQIAKNKVKICCKCNHDGSSSRAKTCDVEIDKKRCHGEWNVSLNPETLIQIIINEVTPAAEDLVLNTFDDANTGIKQENYYRNLSACKNGSIICPFYKLCWKGSEEDLVQLKKK